MTDAIPVIVVIDTAGVLGACAAPSLDANAPASVGEGLCFLIASPRAASRGLATRVLTLRAANRDSQRVCWRSVSLSGNAGQSAVIYDVARDSRTRLATARLTPVVQPLPVVDPRSAGEPRYSPVEAMGYSVETPFERGVYRIRFYITGADKAGAPALAGYFAWDAALA